MSGSRKSTSGMLQGFTLAVAVLAIASVAAAPAQADDIKAAVMIIETGSINQPAVESVPGADVLAHTIHVGRDPGR